MDERELINNKKIVENDLSERYGLLIMEAVVTILLFATITAVIVVLFNILPVKIVFFSMAGLVAIFKIYTCSYVIYSFKNAKFTVETDTIEEIQPDIVFYIGEIVTTRIIRRIYFRPPKRVAFKNSGKVVVHESEISEHCRTGDKFYLVKIKIFGKNKIVSFYNEKAYRYEDKSSKN